MSSNASSGEPSSVPTERTPLFQTNYPGRCLTLFSVFFAFGCFFVVMMSMDLFREWRANNQFVEHQCVVVGKQLIVPHFRGGYKPHISIKYTVNGQEFQATTYSANDNWGHPRAKAQDILARFEMGREYPCWYDPDDPAKAVLARGYTWVEYLIGIVPLAIMIAFGIGMYACWQRLRTNLPTQTDPSAATGRSIQ
ncbi:hypothetical protein AYO44_06985 [Planctomycetaceae bacterium SCGC AG-212-F19]|nr:hypothetical protein AYO44_06985 [Planctomycetaceae bacterium SCGC AG-212-F19]